MEATKKKKPLSENGTIRAQAREKLAGRWLKTTGITLLIVLPFVIALCVLCYLLLSGPQPVFLYAVYGALLLLLLIAWPVLSFGFVRYFLQFAKGETPTPRICFSFFTKNAGKALRLSLLLWAKIGVWMLPGLSLMVCFLLDVFASLGTTVGEILFCASIVLMLIPAMIASLRYRLVPYFFVENPQAPLQEAVQKGIAAMAGQKWKLFCLLFTTAGWASATLSVVEEIFPILKDPPYSIIVRLLMTPLTVYQKVAVACFYLRKTGQTAAEPSSEPAEPTEPVMPA